MTVPGFFLNVLHHEYRVIPFGWDSRRKRHTSSAVCQRIDHLDQARTHGSGDAGLLLQEHAPACAAWRQARLLQLLRQMEALGLKDRKHFADAYLKPALAAGHIEMTQPDKPNSRLQKYRLKPK